MIGSANVFDIGKLGHPNHAQSCKENINMKVFTWMPIT